MTRSSASSQGSQESTLQAAEYATCLPLLSSQKASEEGTWKFQVAQRPNTPHIPVPPHSRGPWPLVWQGWAGVIDRPWRQTTCITRGLCHLPVGRVTLIE